MDRTERLDQISKEMDEILKIQSAIHERQRTLDLKSDKYKELDKQDKDLSQKWEELMDEHSKLMKEEFAEAYTIIEDTEAIHKELEDSGFFEKLNKSSAVLENPDAYTEDEVREAQEFENGLKEAFIKYAEENPDGLIQIAYENEE